MKISPATRRWTLSGTWGQQALSLGEFAQTVHGFIGAMQLIHSDYRDLLILGGSRNDSLKLESDLSNLDEWLYSSACHPNPSKQLAYTNRDHKGMATANTTGAMGFTLWLVDDLFASSKGGMNVKVSAGRDGVLINGVQLDFYLPTRHDMLVLDLQEQLLKAAIDHWPLEHAALTSDLFIEQLEILSDSRSHFLDVGWITYSRDAARGSVLPENIARKPFGPNGVLITATDHEPSPNNKQDVDRLKLIRDIWQENGLLNMTWDKW